MKKIAVLTATRAEYGLLRPLIKKLSAKKELEVKVVVTGTHLSPEFGMTVNEIEKDGILIDKRIEILMSSDTSVSVSKSMGLALISFAEYFAESRPDALLVLGDRYETLAVCCAAMNARIPIFHMYGGETTEGAVDEAIRHSITKMSYLHFTSTEEYRQRVIQLGESPQRVYTVGAIGVENVLNVDLLSREELELELGVCLGTRYAVVTFHPVTLEDSSAKMQMKELLRVTQEYKDMFFLFTMANADADGRTVNACIEDYQREHTNVRLFTSLGVRNYLSAIKYAEVVIGNSSSGLVEVPSFRVPTVNIGDRQRGRLRAESVIDCEPTFDEIKKAVDFALSDEFKENVCSNVKNPYGDGKTSDKILDIITEWALKDEVDIKKKFYDIK